MNSRLLKGFSLGELLVAMGLFAVAILAVLALSISITRTNQEGEDTAVAGIVANHLIERAIDRVRADVPAGLRADFWDNDHSTTPWDEGEFEDNSTIYEYKLFATTVRNTSGDNIGGATPQNRLKKVDIVLYWWNSDTNERQGYGQLQLHNSRLVSEGEI